MQKYLFIIIILIFISCGNNTKPSTSCDKVNCGAGHCEIINSQASCICDNGYHNSGLSCEKNFSCLQLDCGEHGACILDNKTPKCECKNGYSGENCDSCDEGFQDSNNDGICNRTCENLNLNCNNGHCDYKNGKAKCFCDDNYSGSVCNIKAQKTLKINLLDQWGRKLNLENFNISIKLNSNLIEDNFFKNKNKIEEGNYIITVKDKKDEFFNLEFTFNANTKNDNVKIKDISLKNPDNKKDFPLPNHSYTYHIDSDKNLNQQENHIFYIGLAHKWFAPTAKPYFDGNEIELFIDGENAWKDIANSIKNTENEISYVTWGWHDDMELIRPLEIQSQEQRSKNKIISLIEQENVKTKIIVAQFWKQDSIFTNWVSQSPGLKAFAENKDDNVEFMIQANPTNENYRLFFNNASFTERLLKNDNYRFTYKNTFIKGKNIEPFICGDLDSDENCTFYHDVDLHLPFGLEIGIASYHQKFIILDRELAYVGGMNTKREYWDTSKHEVFDHRRMPFDASEEDRMKVRDGNSKGIREPAKIAPYKDYFTRIKGPIVKDVHDIFSKRWNYILHSDAKFSENSTHINKMNEYSKEKDNGLKAQITVTMPRPFQENTILESQILAIKQAKYYIYIEDQYFRIPILNKIIAKRLLEVPNLKVIIITRPMTGKDEWTNGGCFWTSKSYEFFMNNFSNRVSFYQLKAFDFTYPKYNCNDINYLDCTIGQGHGCCGNELNGYFKIFYLHSKMMIVDDKYMSIGSANKNNRGFLYEGEMNVSILNENWVKKQRKRIFKNLFGTKYTEIQNSWEKEDNLKIYNYFIERAKFNQQAFDNWDTDIIEGGEKRDENLDLDYSSKTKEEVATELNKDKNHTPIGFLYPLSFVEPSKCNFEDLGEDAYK